MNIFKKRYFVMLLLVVLVIGVSVAGLLRWGVISAMTVSVGAETENSDSSQLYLVKDNKPQSVIVDQNNGEYTEAVKELQTDIQRATGVELSIVSIDDLPQVPEDYVQVLIGAGAITQSLGVEFTDTDQQTYRVAAIGRHLVLSGSEPEAVLWAVTYFLDRYMGVRWLWPGEVGTYVPQHESIMLPDVDVTERPRLLSRTLALKDQTRAPVEGAQWASRHRLTDKSKYDLEQHDFTDWFNKYGQQHPEYFASPPPGEKQVIPSRIKLDISNPAVDEAIINEWKSAGMPDSWGVAPNDGNGFCVSVGCLAMDIPPNQSITDIWRGKVSLTARYVSFWNRLLGKMRALNPNVTLSSLAYSAYREPPQSGITLQPGMTLVFVNTYQAYEQWTGWFDAGASGLILRPNWWHTGAMASVLPLHAQGNYFKFAMEHGMTGFYFDAILGYWGTQGPNYYLIARLSERPDLSVDEVIAEYASAFGHAAPAILDYLAYWEQFTEETAYTIPAGGSVSQNSQGTYETLARQYKFPDAPLIGGWYVLPYLYTDEVLGKARALLDQAEQLAVNDNRYVHDRITFLRDGLRHLELTREVMRYGYKGTRPEGATLDDFIKLRKQLDKLRQDLTPSHVVWGKVLNNLEAKRNVPTNESRIPEWTTTGTDHEKTTEEINSEFDGL